MRSVAILFLAALAGGAWAQDAAVAPPASPPDADAAVRRGIEFLVKDAKAWKSEHECVSCHHAALTVWALREAKERGVAVDEPFLAEYTKWLAESGSGKTGVPRPEGRPKALNVKAVHFALALEAEPKPDPVAQAGLKLLLGTVAEDQTENGSWVGWPESRAPMIGGSDDSMTALATLATLPAAAAGDEAMKAVRDLGMKWLAETKTDDDPQSVAIRLVLWIKMERPAAEWEPWARRIIERQNADGGWNQAEGMASDAWATGQAIYALSTAGIDSAKPAITRGREFLVKTQREDGSWAMTSRPSTPGGPGSNSLIPIVGAGSAWGVLGLARNR